MPAGGLDDDRGACCGEVSENDKEITMRAKFCAVKHEAVFEVTSGLDAGQVVRLPFHDSETAEDLGPAVAELLNNPNAKERCRDLHRALSLYLDDSDGGESAVASVNNAAAVLNCIELLRAETRQPVA